MPHAHRMTVPTGKLSQPRWIGYGRQGGNLKIQIRTRQYITPTKCYLATAGAGLVAGADLVVVADLVDSAATWAAFCMAGA